MQDYLKRTVSNMFPGFKIEIVHPSMQCIVGFQYFAPDDESDYETFKLHFLWIVLRWDWV